MIPQMSEQSDWDEVPSEPPYPREIHLVTVFSQYAPKKLKHIYVYIPIIYTFPLFYANIITLDMTKIHF